MLRRSFQHAWNFPMKFVLLFLALSLAATASAVAQTKRQASTAEQYRKARQAAIQKKPQIVSACVANLRQNPQAGKHSDATRRMFCSCAFDHMIRTSREEMKDWTASKLPLGSMGERMYIAGTDCMTKAKMWPTQIP
jgi:hypothetical protein